jgi:hypothetical protein
VKLGKPKKQGWALAKHLCRLNQDDIAMAKRLGFRPESLIRSRPDPKQKWKLPVKLWIRDLHLQKFGYIKGEDLLKATDAPEFTAEEVRTLEEQMYWEDYWSRNDEDPPKHRKQAASMRQGQPRSTLCGPSEPEKEPVILTDDDVPF